MRTATVSTHALNLALRNSTAQLQGQLPRLQKEVVDGVHADSGLALGAETRKLEAFRHDIDHTQRLIDTNSQIQSRLTTTQAGMSYLSELSQNLISSVGIVMGDTGQYATAQQTAASTVAEITSVLNTQVNGVFVFGGRHTDDQPLADYETGGAKAAFDAAFQSYFGFTKSDAAASGITNNQIEGFLNSDVMDLYLGAGWAANVSQASDEAIVSRLDSGVTADTSVSANESGFRKLMMSAVVASELFEGNLNAEAMMSVSQFVISNLGSATGDITDIQGGIGLVEARITRVNEALETQKSLLETFASDLNSIDPYAASIQINTLMTQLETSYQITARLQGMSLMNYL